MTTIPVLVSAVESNLPYAEMLAPLTTIRDEHRSIAAVIHGLEFVARQARDQGAPPSFPLLRAMLHYIVAFPEKLHHPKEDAYLFRKLRERTSEFDATLDELERQQSTATSSSRNWRGASTPTRRIRERGLTGFAEAVDRFSTSQIQHMALEAKVIIPAARVHLTARRLGGDRRGVRRERRSALLGRQRRGVPRAVRADHQSRAGAGCKRTGARPRSNVQFNNSLGRRKTMQHQSTAASRAAAHRRRATALAIAALFAASGAVQAFDIDTGNPDIQMRWDNTLRYNLGVRAQSQDSKIIGNPNFDDGDRNFDKGSLVTNRLDVLSEFDFVYKRKFGFRVSAAGWYDNAYSHLDNTNNATANTLVNGLPVAGVLSDYTKRYAKGPSGELLDAFGFANFDVGDVPVNVKAGQHTVYWGDSLLLGGAIHGVSYAQNPLNVWKGFATPGSEAKELFMPRGGITLQAQPLKELSIAGAMVLQLAGRSHSGIGQLPDDPGSAQFRRRFVHLRTQSARRGDSRRAVVPAPLARAGHQAADELGSLGDWGVSARWSPDWLDGTLGFYYRNATDVFPQAMVTPGVAPVPAAVCSARGGMPLPGGTLCFVNPERDDGRRPAEVRQARALQRRVRRRHPHLRHHAGEEHRRRERRRGALVSAEHAARERPGAGAPRGIRAARARLDRDDGGADERHAWRAGRHVARRAQRGQHLPDDPAVRYRSARGRAHLDAVVEGDAERGGVQGAQQLHADRQGRRRTSSVSRSTSRRRGSRCFRASTCLHPSPGARGFRATRPSCSAAARAAATGAPASPPTSIRSTAIDLKYNGYYGDYSTNPTAATPAGGVLGVPNGANSSLSDRGWVSLTFKTTF